MPFDAGCDIHSANELQEQVRALNDMLNQAQGVGKNCVRCREDDRR